MLQIFRLQLLLTELRAFGLQMSDYVNTKKGLRITFIAIDVTEQLHEEICAATGDMNQWSLFSKPHPGCNCKTLQKSATKHSMLSVNLPAQVI